ncbi:DNA-binding response regulator, NarL/FixJ family, contains REC and HTH domains [Catalinimonas alkaloidigena]|uniref:DNA-binding response regulator, NarL/FixJ family, contains REC and HTH domains n=1 Tax=Catalinimonas alkaloidigena TaxID=1075417 RepID=A0A1G9H5Q5_9BACT|nr:response regulator transcription factor [Catalinimonas alkaloidigena]SDL08094.1 DNA-binding response regulator, NarL/FixJ family, contains REC and HTH domains [Catalinimonas alkaloidigena]
MPPVRLAIADDHQIFRQGLLACLRECDAIDVLIEAVNGRDLLDKMQATPVDVVLMDIKMPMMDGMKATEALRQKYTDTQVLALSMFDDDQYILNMMRAGAAGYLLKNAAPDEIIEAVTTVQHKGYYFNDRVSVALIKKLVNPQALPDPPPAAQVDLNERELEVLTLICQEYTSAEIADQLCLSTRTVEGYRTRLFEKIGAKNTVGLVMYAIRNGLIHV